MSKISCKPDLKRQKILRKQYEPITEERKKQQGEQVKFLLAIKLPEQRTEGWYKMRESFITASDWGKVLGVNTHGNSTKSIVLSKCGVRRGFAPKSGALEWGVRYEEIATRLYEKRNNIEIIEFGCIPHQKISFLGASPDGITPHGIMLEIKCPYSRVINGTVPPQYWAQVQGQLEVCELDMCDYLEVKLIEYSGLEQYLKDDFEEKGCVACFERKDGSWMYEYSEFTIDREQYEAWIEEIVTRNVVENRMKYKWCKYWKATIYSVVRIYRDQVWFQERALPMLKAFWEEEVLPCKKNGYAHLLPKPKELKGTFMETLVDEELVKGCDKSDQAVKMYLNPKMMVGHYLFTMNGSEYELTDELIGYHDDDYNEDSSVKPKEIEEQFNYDDDEYSSDDDMPTLKGTFMFSSSKPTSSKSTFSKPTSSKFGYLFSTPEKSKTNVFSKSTASKQTAFKPKAKFGYMFSSFSKTESKIPTKPPTIKLPKRSPFLKSKRFPFTQ